MDYHNGVRCDGCKQSSFTGRRFKCLICCDFDLCGVCYNSKKVGSEQTEHASSEQHTADHPMQCILTMADMLRYFGVNFPFTEARAVSFTCPLCGTLGYSEFALTSHCISEHPDSSCGDVEVICPVCAANPKDDHVQIQTKTLASHLKSEHSQMPNPDENGFRARAKETARRRRRILSDASSRRNLFSDSVSEASRLTTAALVSSKLAELDNEEQQLQNTQAQLELLSVLEKSRLATHISIINSLERKILANQLISTLSEEPTEDVLAEEAAAENPEVQTEPEIREQPLPVVALNLNKDRYPLLSRVVDEATMSSTPDVVDRASYLSYLLIGNLINPLTHLATE